jgi:hypothetical protein
VFLSGESARVYQPRLIEGYRAEMFPTRGFRKGQGVIGMVAKLRLPLVVVDARREVQPMRGFGRTLGTNAYCVLPIVVHGNCIGVVLADNQNEPFTAEQVELLSAFVNQAGIALENARLYREMERRYQEIQELAAFRNNILRSLSSGCSPSTSRASSPLGTARRSGTWASRRARASGALMPKCCARPSARLPPNTASSCAKPFAKCCTARAGARAV